MAIVSGEAGALLAIEILPLAPPAIAGAKLAVNEALCPELIVSGTAKPVILKPVPEAAA
jgi:hypothetical protein